LFIELAVCYSSVRKLDTRHLGSGWQEQTANSGAARNFIKSGQKIYRKTLLPSCE